MEEMKSCPFCGSAGELVRTKDNSGYWVPWCKNYNCGARLFARPTQEEAISYWNEGVE